jgi:hypothetical protein
MENKIDINKKYTTRQGLEVKLFTTEGRCNGGEVIGEVFTGVGMGWEAIKRYPDGSVWGNGREDMLDLIEVKEKIKLTGFLNVYKYGVSELYPCQFDAKREAKSKIMAILDLSKYNIEFEEGEGIV